MKSRLDTLRIAIERYQKSLESLTAMNEELRTLPTSQRLGDVLQLNEQTMHTTRRLLETAVERLRNEEKLTAGSAWLRDEPS